MNQAGNGLFNRDLIRSIKERWYDGGIGVVFISLRSGGVSAELALHQWEREQTHIFWRQRLEWDHVYFFARTHKDEPIDRLTERAAALLNRQMLALSADIESQQHEDKTFEFKVGTALAYPPATGRSTEAVLFRMLLDAMEDSSYNHSSNASIEMQHTSLETDNSLSVPVELNGEADSDKHIQQMAAGMPGKAARIASLAAPFPIFPASALVSEVAYFFDTHAKALGAVIVNQGSPTGILMKEKLHQMLAGQFGLPLYWNRPVERIMNKQPLIVDEQLPVEQVSQLAMSRDFTMNDVVLITREGQLTGAATVQAILEYMASLRTEAARGANPLTGLPGNEEIQLELQRRIALRQAVAVIYADLDYFKWYNDMFGFGLGDNLICFLANVLREEIGKLGVGGKQSFIGHIGGDDFIVITEESSAEQLCQAIIQRFDSGIKAFYGDVEVTSVEDRHGNVIEQEGVTLSLSLMIWEGKEPVTPEYISRFSAKLKKHAKAHKGSVYVKELLEGERHEVGLGK